MKRGFTLIELLIVIAILAILATTVVLVLNPAQILAQARDSQRISDLSSVKSAIALYLATAASPSVTSTAMCTVTGCANPGPFTVSQTISTSTAVDSTGWVRVDLRQTSGGTSLSALPLDPTGSTDYYYAYRGDNANSTFKLGGRLESIKYRPMMSTDGGIRNACTTWVGADCYYEVGTDMAL